jgi:hypothetical protein
MSGKSGVMHIPTGERRVDGDLGWELMGGGDGGGFGSLGFWFTEGNDKGSPRSAVGVASVDLTRITDVASVKATVLRSVAVISSSSELSPSPPKMTDMSSSETLPESSLSSDEWLDWSVSI